MTAITKTLEQLRVEAAEAAAALAEAQRAEQQKARDLQRAEAEAKAKAARIERNTKLVALLEPIARAFRTAGFADAAVVSPEGSFPHVTPGAGFRVDVCVTMSEARVGGSTWHAGHFAGYKVSMGGYGDRKFWPQRNDGSFNADKIAAEAKRRIDAHTEEQRKQAQQNEAKLNGKALADQVKASLGLEATSSVITHEHSYTLPRGGNRVEYRSYTADAGKVFVNVGQMQCTPEEAAVLIEAVNKVKAMRTAVFNAQQ